LFLTILKASLVEKNRKYNILPKENFLKKLDSPVTFFKVLLYCFFKNFKNSGGSMKKFVYLFFLGLSFLFFTSCNETTNQTTEENIFSGTLYDEQGNPVPNAIINVVKISDGKTNILVSEQVIVTDTTDEEGNFELKNLPSPLGSLKVRIVHQDFSVFEEFLLKILENQDKRKLRVHLKHDDHCCGKIIIHTYTSDSSALGNVEVRLNRGHELVRKSKTNDNGVLVFERVCSGSYWVRIAKEGFQVIEREFNLQNCDTLEFSFYLYRRETDTCCHGIIGIEVKNGSGEFLNGAIVKLRKQGTLLTTLTVKENKPVFFRELCPGEYSLLIYKEGYKPLERNVRIECNDSTFISTVLEVDTCCNSVLRVIVKNSEGNPIPQAKVSIWKGGIQLGYYLTNDDGVVVFRDLCKGTYGFSISKDGFKAIEFQVEIGCNEEKSVTKTLEALHSDSCCKGAIKVAVKNHENQPIPQALVIIWKDGKKLDSASTNSDGYVIFKNLCQGKYGFDIFKEGYKHIEFAVELGCNEEKIVTQVLQRTENDSCCNGLLVVHVKDKQTNESLNGAKVKMWKNGAVVRSETVSNGSAIFRNICPGEYGFSIIKDTYKTIEFSLEFACNDTIEITKYLESERKDTCCNGKVILYVKDSTNSQGIAGVEVRLWNGSQKIAVRTTGENGRVVFEKICSGKYSISMSKSGYRSKEFEFELGCNETKELVKYLVLSSDTCCTAILKLKILDDSTGTAISGARVIVRYEGTNIADPVSNSEGWAVAYNLCAPRTYSIRVSAEGYQVREFTIRFGECKTIAETIRLVRQ